MFGRKKKLAEEYCRQGTALAEKEKYEEAIEALNKAVQANPKHAKAHMVLAISYAGVRDFESARRHYEILKNLDGDLAKRVENTPVGVMIVRGTRVIEF